MCEREEGGKRGTKRPKECMNTKKKKTRKLGFMCLCGFNIPLYPSRTHTHLLFHTRTEEEEKYCCCRTTAATTEINKTT